MAERIPRLPLTPLRRTKDRAQSGPQIVNLIEQGQDHRDRLVLDPHHRAQIVDQPDPRDVDLMKDRSTATGFRAHPAAVDPGGEFRLGQPRRCTCKDALATAIITRPEHVPEQTKKELEPIIGKYMR